MIESFSNSKIKHLRRLQQRKHRQKSASFVLEGRQLIQEALQANFELIQLFHDASYVGAFKAQAQEAFEVSADVLAYASSLKSPPEMIAVFAQRECVENTARAQAWLVTESLQDPGNFGALIRLADAMNWRGIRALGDFPDPFQPKVLRASMGSVLRVPVQPVSYDELSLKREQGWQILGSALQAQTSSYASRFQQPLLLLLGHEGQGLSEQALALCTERIRIPMQAQVDSLNVVTAAAMLVHEACRQWHPSTSQGRVDV